MKFLSRAKSLQHQLEMMANNTNTKVARFSPEDFELMKIHLLSPLMRKNVKDSFVWKGIEIIKI